MVRPVAERLLKYSEFRRGWLGITSTICCRL
jgi:hypothetical protein